MRDRLLDFYGNFLIASLESVSATMLSRASNYEISHDKISRHLRNSDYSSRDFWKVIKKFIRKIETPEGIIAIDDFVVHHPHMSDNSVVNYNYDHSQGRMVMGAVVVDAVYRSEIGCCPLDYKIVTKTEAEFDHEKQQFIRQQDQDKNSIFREILWNAKLNNVKFKFVVADKWYASAENMKFIRNKIGAHFVMPIKSNRNIKLLDDTKSDYVAISEIALEPERLYRAKLKGLSTQVWVMKIIFKNEDKSDGVLFLVTSCDGMTPEKVQEVYKFRWSIEEQHKSLKQNTGIERCSSPSPKYQMNHIFCCFSALLKLCVMKFNTGQNHFAIKVILKVEALRATLDQLNRLSPLIRIC
jgi:hypothetical protein